MRRKRAFRALIFPDFVANGCCNPCCRDTGVVAQVAAAETNTGNCCCCCNCCNCGSVAGAQSGCGNVGGVSDNRRPCPPPARPWGELGGAYDFGGYCPCRDYPTFERVE